MLSALLRLPIYCAVLFFLFWSVQISGFLYYVDFLNFTTPRADLLRWAFMMSDFFRIRYYRIGGHQLHTKGPCVYLCNHRSWSDFFVEQYLTSGRCCAISRVMVFVALPVFMLYGYVGQSMLFFKRNAIRDKEKFNAWLDKSLKQSPYNGVIVYPEGHRNMLAQSLPLKKGMITYAYLRKIPCQIIIGKNKEMPFSEKKWRVQFGCDIYAGYSRLIDPGSYPRFEDFFAEIRKEWDLLWAAVFSTTSPAGLEPLVWRDYETFDFPFVLRLKCAGAMILGQVLFLALMYYAGRWLLMG